MEDQSLAEQLRNVSIKNVALGPLQQLIYSTTGEELKCKVALSGVWVGLSVWLTVNSAGIYALGPIACAVWEFQDSGQSVPGC